LPWFGLALSFLLLAGISNALLLLLLWALYASYVHIGQIWYGFGWETQLLETGAIAVFMAPLFEWRPKLEKAAPQVVLWLFRWLIFRIMLGAALIKLRGDPCWRDFSCLETFFETQPLPNPLSPYFHFLPPNLLAAGVAFNYLAELIAPFFLLLPWTWARVSAGLVMAAFQITLLLSGNLSFLNWLTLVPILACFDDRQWRQILPVAWAQALAPDRPEAASPLSEGAAWTFALLVAVLSWAPVKNLCSANQAMNTNFDSFDLVNTYGAFGSVGKEREQLVIEGTRSEAADPKADWIPYVLPCQAGPLDRRPCICAPYQYRLDWQLWFAGMEAPDNEPWIFPLIWKLLQNDSETLTLFSGNPFPEAPPRYIRIRLFRYAFERLSHPAGNWWRREELGLWLPPLSLDDLRLQSVLRQLGREDLLGNSGGTPLPGRP
jgi:hypothetical protein